LGAVREKLREEMAAGFKAVGDKVNPPEDKVKVVPWGTR